jgi:hypothetical protein
VVHAGQLGDVEAADRLLPGLVLRILLDRLDGERLQVDAVVLRAWVGEPAAAELLDEAAAANLTRRGREPVQSS